MEIEATEGLLNPILEDLVFVMHLLLCRRTTTFTDFTDLTGMINLIDLATLALASRCMN